MNPFRYGSVVKAPYFYNRENELERITSTLAGGNNLVLYAPRRFGKTSLVVKALNKLEDDGFTVIYLDFMAVYSRESFINLYTKKIFQADKKKLPLLMEKLGQWLKGVKPIVELNDDGSPRFSVQYQETELSVKTLEEIIDLPEHMAEKGQRYIIAFDEFQEINSLNGDSFENILRSRIQHQTKVSYIFLGSKVHMLRDMFNNRNRPFYNSAMIMELSSIEKDKSISYLKDRFQDSGIKLNTEMAELLIQCAGNIPYYIQMLASEIWQQLIDQGKEVTGELVHSCAKEIINLKRDFYQEQFAVLSATKKKILQALCRSGKNIFSRDYTAMYRLPAISTTQKAVLSLVNDGLVDKLNDEYFISDPFFKEFILSI